MNVERSLLAGAVALVTVAGCGSSGSTTTAASAAPSAKAAMKSAPAKAATKDDTAKVAGKVKGAKPKLADAKKEASKGDPSAKDKPIPKEAHKVDASDTKARNKKKVASPPAGACAAADDGVGVCAGNSLYFCAGEDLMVVDCDELGRMSGFHGGTCLDTTREVDCMGLMMNSGGVQVYCDAVENLCCDSDGFCWVDETAGDAWVAGDSEPAVDLDPVVEAEPAGDPPAADPEPAHEDHPQPAGDDDEDTPH